MEIRRKLVIRERGKSSDSRMLLQVFVEFCKKYSKKYKYLPDKSLDYQRQISADACMIHRWDQFPYPLLAFATADGATMQLFNVIPQEIGEIDVSNYNGVAFEFYKDFKKCAFDNARISCTSENCDLKDVISGRKTRSFFESYLNQHPISYHALDVARLDLFICALHRFSSGEIDIDRLRQYLISVLLWKKKHVDWCCNRIAVGLDVLRANKNF